MTATADGVSGAGLLPPTGSATFLDGTTSLGTSELSQSGTNQSQALLRVASLSVGSHTLDTSYSGDGNYNTGSWPGLSFTVNQASTTTTLASSANPAALCQSVTFTAKVNAVTP